MFLRGLICMCIYAREMRFFTPTVIGIAYSIYRLAIGWTTLGSEFESRYGQEFSLLHVIKTDCGAQPASYLMGNGDSFPGVKRLGREADHSPQASAEVKKM
jgi:hypothetical protein